ncbi:MAG TPA: TadE/TadG family type IV pilus assembly protein [Gemmataceae bacterium]|nr:TadE/TadG family type IV pilus assembly protein [Gemmataceae bacterium]
MMLARKTRRPGFVNAVELIFVLPIVIITFIVIVQFSQILAAEARLCGASREGARVAASGGNTRQIRKAVHSCLLPREHKMVQIETNALESDGGPKSVPPGTEVVVRVSVATKDIVPSTLLSCFFDKNVLVGQTVMRKE